VKFQARVDALDLAAEGRLFVEVGTSDFVVKAGDELQDADPDLSDAADDLRDNLDLEDGDEGSGPEGLTPVVITPQGAALLEQWMR